MVQYGGQFVRVAPLTIKQNLICIGIGASSLIVGIFIKIIIPVRIFQ